MFIEVQFKITNSFDRAICYKFTYPRNSEFLNESTKNIIETTMPLPVLLHETTVTRLPQMDLLKGVFPGHFLHTKKKIRAQAIPANAITPITIPTMAPPFLQIKKKLFSDRQLLLFKNKKARYSDITNQIYLKKLF